MGKAMPKRKPMITLDTFVDGHLQRQAQLEAYAASALGRRVVDEGLLARLARHNAMSLNATNSYSRLAFGRATSDALDEYAKIHTGENCHFLTLTPAMFGMPLSSAAHFDVDQIRNWVEDILGSMNYFGMVDLGYFSNFSLPGFPKEPSVSWHTHLDVFDQPNETIMALVHNLNLRTASHIPGHRAADVLLLRPREIKGRGFYMAKAPRSEYRVIAQSTEVSDPLTGEVNRALDIKKRALRKGDAVKLCKVLGDRTLPQLVLAGGSVETLPNVIEKQAKSMLAREIREHEQTLREVSGLK
jgi:hypothetical protein